MAWHFLVWVRLCLSRDEMCGYTEEAYYTYPHTT